MLYEEGSIECRKLRTLPTRTGHMYSYLRNLRRLFPTAIHAFQLIPYMYKRLTSVDGLSHKAAVTKIKEDHKDLSGFSYRNISRSLPKDSSIVPRRVVPSRHKSIDTELNHPTKLSITKSSYSDGQLEGKPTVNEINEQSMSRLQSSHTENSGT